MSNLTSIIDEAPTFKDLLWAIMDEHRAQLLNSKLWIFLESQIKIKCEEAALNLKTSITIQDLNICSSSSFFKSIGSKYSNDALLDTIHCICDKLDLDFDSKTISWGRTNVSPKEG